MSSSFALVARIALLVATAIGGASCVSGVDELSTRASPIIGGSADTTDVAVVALRQISTGTLCSGTLVAPNIVLTAAHCVFQVSAADLQVLVGADIEAPDQTATVSSVVVYPTYTGESEGLTGGVDLGAVYLAAPLSIPPIAVSTTTTDGDFTGAQVTLVGYGISSTADSSGAGTRRSVTTSVTTICSRLLSLGTADANECSGDSGGAVLLGGALVAVISSGKPDCIAPSNQTRLDAHATWIASVLAGNGADACPDCVAPDPSCEALIEGESAPPDASVADASGADGGAASPVAGSSGGGGCQVGGGGPGGVGQGLGLLWVAAVFARWGRRGDLDG